MHEYETVQLEFPIRTEAFNIARVDPVTHECDFYEAFGTLASGDRSAVLIPAVFMPEAETAALGCYVLELTRVSSLRGEVPVAVTTPGLRRIGYGATRIAEMQLHARINDEYEVLIREYENGHDPVSMSSIAWDIAKDGPQTLLDDLLIEAMEEGDPPESVHDAYAALSEAICVLIDRAVRYRWWPDPEGVAEETPEGVWIHRKWPLHRRNAAAPVSGLCRSADDAQVATRLCELWGVELSDPLRQGSDSR